MLPERLMSKPSTWEARLFIYQRTLHWEGLYTSRAVSISQGHVARVLVRLPHPLTERHSGSYAPEHPRSPQIHHGDLPLDAIRRRVGFPQRLTIS